MLSAGTPQPGFSPLPGLRASSAGCSSPPQDTGTFLDSPMLPCRDCLGSLSPAGNTPSPFWQGGEGGKRFSCLPACRLRTDAQRGGETFPTMEDNAVPCTARCRPRRWQRSSLLVLIRTKRETGKVQARVKKAQGGSSRISLTSRRVQP